MDRSLSGVTSWFVTAVVGWALSWLCYRAYQVLSKPADELVNLLGLDIPAAPSLTLAAIKPRSVTVHWKAGELDQPKASGIAYQLHLNGVSIGELQLHEPILAIEGLKPDHGYTVRIVTFAVGGFSASSDPIRFHTLPLTLADESTRHRSIDIADDRGESIPIIRTVRNSTESSTPPVAPQMSREHSNSLSYQRRNASGRRAVPGPPPELISEEARAALAAESDIRDLTIQHERIRDETEKIRQLLVIEDNDFNEQQIALAQRRESLRQSFNEKESASKDLRKTINRLEQEEKTARDLKTSAEKRLASKRQDREKIRQDRARWEQQVEAFEAEMEKFHVEQPRHRRRIDEKIGELRQKQAEQTDTNHKLEEVINQQKAQIRELETEKQSMLTGEEDSAVESTAEEDAAWQARMEQLQNKYNQAWQSLDEASRHYQEAQKKLGCWEQLRNESPHMFVASPLVDITNGRKQIKHRGRSSSLRNELSSTLMSYEQPPSSAYSTAMGSIIPIYPPVTSFFSMGNGSVIGPTQPASAMLPTEIEQLTGGAPTSPNAGNFLPSDLLSDDMEPSRFQPSKPSLDTTLLPGLGAPQTLVREAIQDPNSPISNPSGSPSHLASPRDSNTNLPSYPVGEAQLDSDRRSTRSATGSSRAVSISGNATSRFTNLFGFNRQRGKTFSDEGPSLGSLRSSETQSLPRDVFDPVSNGHRSHGSQSGGSWMGLMTHRNTVHGADAGKRSRFNVFGSRTDTWPSPGNGDKPPSPRPASTNSSESNLLPRPSAAIESRFGWPVSGEGFSQRHSPLATDWGVAATSSWSRHPSRRPSQQYNSYASGAEHVLAEDEDGETELADADFDTLPAGESPRQAPIGTRPQSSSQASLMAARLNPNAPSFKMLFANKTAKAEKYQEDTKESKKKRKGKDKDSGRTDTDVSPAGISVELANDYSTHLSESRYSRDARSLSTVDDGTSEPRTSLDKYSSLSPSDADPPGSATRESFMQRLSRKSSASMFGLSSRLLKTKSATGGAAQEPDTGGETPDETDEEGITNGHSTPGLTTPMGKLGDVNPMDKNGSPALTPARQSAEKQRTGFSFRSLTGRKKDKGGASTSAASETGDDESIADD